VQELVEHIRHPVQSLLFPFDGSYVHVQDEPGQYMIWIDHIIKAVVFPFEEEKPVFNDPALYRILVIVHEFEFLPHLNDPLA